VLEFSAYSHCNSTNSMVLSLRRTPLERATAMAHLEDWQVLDDGKPVGRLYQAHTAAPPEIIWHWSITEYVEPRSGLRTSGTAETFDAAKAAFQNTRDKWRDWATQAGFDSSSG
jgi:hypothetical protein